MKTSEIVKGLLKIAERSEFDAETGICYECGCIEEHEKDCRYVSLTEAAKEYLKLMEGSKT